jgi:hypothetical protein
MFELGSVDNYTPSGGGVNLRCLVRSVIRSRPRQATSIPRLLKWVKHLESKTAYLCEKAVVISRIPWGVVVIDKIMDHPAVDSDFRSLRSCVLVSNRGFHSAGGTSSAPSPSLIVRRSGGSGRFWSPGGGPPHYVRYLRFSLAWCTKTVPGFSEHIPWFTNVEKMTLLCGGGYRLMCIPSLGRLPRSPISLIINR